MQATPYLFFNGRCEEALDFYQTHLGAETTMMMRYSESPQPCAEGMIPSGWEQKVMHASWRLGQTEMMASDGNSPQPQPMTGAALAITAPDDAAAERMFAALSDGGQVQMPMMETFFATRFGMVADRFGVSWMVMCPKAESRPD
ncbi:MAG TPA: VOC family protein [Lacipirellulaceae bacterium]|nr:VOC family protein [Lacipirellulaceae bacterium]HMP08145.1 VOC family protein [Lacipirellulaceae bacterium]